MEVRNGKYREMIWMGNRLIKSPFFSRKTDAALWKANKLNERTKSQVLGEEYKTQSKLTFADFAHDWLEVKIKPSKSPSTYCDYGRILRCHLNQPLADKLLKDIRIRDADSLVSVLVKKGLSAKGIQDILTLLKQILNEAEKREEILKNHLRHYKGPKVPQTQFKYWSDSEINKFLLSAQGNEYYSFFVTAFYTGMRKGEMAALTWECIDFHKNLIIVKGTLDKFGHRESTKSGKIRYVPLNGFLKGILLERLKKRSTSSPYVFELNGKPLDTNHLYRVFTSLQKKAGITNVIRVHDTRHTFASQFMMKGLGSLFELSLILGHSDTKMTQRYAHLSPSHLSMATQNLKFGSEGELSKEFTPILPPTNNHEERDNFWDKDLRLLESV
jgi:integrase